MARIIEIRAIVHSVEARGPLHVGSVVEAPRSWADRGDTPSALRYLAGRPIFWRAQRRWADFYHFRSQSVGCDLAAWEAAVARGARFMVRLAKDNGRMVVAGADSRTTFNVSFGQGLQIRWRDFMTVERAADFAPHYRADPDEIVTVESREP